MSLGSEQFVSPSDVVTSMLVDLFETIENSSSSPNAPDITFFIGKCSNYMKQKGVYAILQGRDCRRGREGYTLLHAVARVGNEQLASYLIEHGADVNAVDNSRNLQTPLMFAIEAHMFDVATLLAAHGSRLDAEDCNGHNIFHYFARMNNALYLKKTVNASNISAFDIQSIASKQAIHRKKPYPEDYAPDTSITQEVLRSYREQGSYLSTNDIKILHKSGDMNNGGGRRRTRSKGGVRKATTKALNDRTETTDGMGTDSAGLSFSEFAPGNGITMEE
jgi:hypothetical protein